MLHLRTLALVLGTPVAVGGEVQILFRSVAAGGLWGLVVSNI